MGSSSPSVGYNGGFVEGEKKYKESDIKVINLYWRDVPLASIGGEIATIGFRTLTLGLSEIIFKGKDLSHDIIVVETDKGSNYVLEWLLGNKLRPGYYSIFNRNSYNKKYDYTPKKNMKLSDLRKIMNKYPGYGDCKDHVRFWWEKIKENY